jgi:hypothetical protein
MRATHVVDANNADVAISTIAALAREKLAPT